MKTYCKTLLLFFASSLLFSCNETNVDTDTSPLPPQRTRVATYPKIVAYIEVNDVNPLNAGSYVKSDGNPAIDVAILFAANINGPFPVSTTETILFNNENVSAIISNPAKYIKPLQDKGIKVLYGLLGNHTGLGFSNLTAAQVEDFAQKVATQVIAAGLDGVDFDDEWAGYGQNGYPNSNATSFNKLVIRLRQLLPGKIISVFDTGMTNFTEAGISGLDYGFPAVTSPTDFVANPGMGLPNYKWAPMAVFYAKVTNLILPQITMNAKRATQGGYGAIVTDISMGKDHTTLLNAIVKGSQGLTVSHDGKWFTKDWI